MLECRFILIYIDFDGNRTIYEFMMEPGPCIKEISGKVRKPHFWCFLYLNSIKRWYHFKKTLTKLTVIKDRILINGIYLIQKRR